MSKQCILCNKDQRTSLSNVILPYVCLCTTLTMPHPDCKDQPQSGRQHQDLTKISWFAKRTPTIFAIRTPS